MHIFINTVLRMIRRWKHEYKVFNLELGPQYVNTFTKNINSLSSSN